MLRLPCSAPLALALACASSSALAGGPESAHHGRGTAGVFWFMHLSDTHIGANAIEGPNATPHLERALGEAVSVIAPRFVAVTGDLTDGSKFGVPTAGQDQGQWDAYKQIYGQAGMTPDFFFDLPGNHDGYGDTGLSFYLANSVQGQHNQALYGSWEVQTPVGTYFFFGLNSAGNGSGPFVEQPAFTADEIAALETGLASHASGELSFVLAHHRLTQPDNAAQVVDAIQTNGGAFYLHGHAHDYDAYTEAGGSIVVHEVGSLGKQDTANIAVGIVDHNAFIHRATDVTAPWPLVVVTTPVSTTLLGGEANPYAYTVCKDRPDNPFRAVVFAPEAPTEVTVQVAGLPAVPMALVPGTGSLWEAELDTSSLQAGTVDVTVTATFQGGATQETAAAEFVDGPCEALPDDGNGGSGGAGLGGAGGAAVGGQGGSGAGSGSTGGAGVGNPADPESASGCGCALPGRATGGGAAVAVLGLALSLVVRRKSAAR